MGIPGAFRVVFSSQRQFSGRPDLVWKSLRTFELGHQARKLEQQAERGECTKNCREMEFWVGGQIPECTKRRSNLASHKGKQEFSAFTNTEIHEYGFPKYRNTGEWVWQGGGMVGEYRNKKRLATPSNATTSKYTNASCQKLKNTPLPKIHQQIHWKWYKIKTKTSIATADHENTH